VGSTPADEFTKAVTPLWSLPAMGVLPPALTTEHVDRRT
jgi:hypothetical protein